MTILYNGRQARKRGKPIYQIPPIQFPYLIKFDYYKDSNTIFHMTEWSYAQIGNTQGNNPKWKLIINHHRSSSDVFFCFRTKEDLFKFRMCISQ